MYTENDRIRPVSELPLVLDDLMYLHLLVQSHYDERPNAFDKALGIGLLALWRYWSKRTHDTATFTLTIKRS
jgi:hypothetical protein